MNLELKEQEAHEIYGLSTLPGWAALVDYLKRVETVIDKMLRDPGNSPTLDAFHKGALQMLDDVINLPIGAFALMENKEEVEK
jgi:hypothetical protein